MAAPELVRVTSHGVTLLGDPNRPGGVTLAFTERTGGISTGDYSSLNLGDGCDDDPAHVAENRRRVLEALGAADMGGRLVNPVQVHGEDVVIVDDSSADALARAQATARAGADAVVCTAEGVPVLLCQADCVPIILVGNAGFAVVHSGWRGTLARIAAKAAKVLGRLTDTRLQDVYAYVGPHIGATDYEVSRELLDRFVEEFGLGVELEGTRLDLGAAVVQALEDAGISPARIACCDESTASHTDRFFSYRAQKGVCGRLGAIAILMPHPCGNVWHDEECHNEGRGEVCA